MAWTTLPTYADGNALTAAQMNAVAANINETAPSKATTSGYHFVSTGTNAIAERAIVSDKILTQQTRTSTSYGNLTTVGGTVTVTTGTKALVHISDQMFSSAANTVWTSYEISSATTASASDEWGIEANGTDGNRLGISELHTVTGGSNVFTMKYRVGGGTGTFDDRIIIVMGL